MKEITERDELKTYIARNLMEDHDLYIGPKNIDYILDLIKEFEGGARVEWKKR